MKREIKFRGLRTDGKGWVYGSLFNASSGLTIIENGGDDMSDFHFIIPESVGQYTGLKDKDGKEIYEGDIVKLTNVGYGFNTGIVVWGAHSTPSFTAEQINEDFPSTYHLQVRPNEIEILGNIHEHKHLLK